MPALTNWAGNISFGATAVARPRTASELQAIVAAARRVRALGTGHSFNEIADTDGILVSVRDLDIGLEIDQAHSAATVPAGLRYGEITGKLDEAGAALHNLGSLPHISVAGACATGTHGSGVGLGNLSSAVIAVEFVAADGELRTLSRQADGQIFDAAVLALGALGVTTRLTLRTEPSYQVRQDVWLDMPFDVFSANVEDVMASGYSVSAFTDFRRPDIIDKIWVKSRADMPAGAPVLEPAEWLGARRADQPQHPISGQDTTAATDQLGVFGPWQTRLPHFRLEFTPSHGEELQSEYLLPRAAAGSALAVLRSQATRLSGPLLVCELRTVAADGMWLSPSYQRDSFAVHFTWVREPDRVLPLLATLDEAFGPLQARPHWGKVFTLGPDYLASVYPRLADFRSVVQRFDPSGKFGNTFLDANLGMSR